jgi:hypothetical protein
MIFFLLLLFPPISISVDDSFTLDQTYVNGVDSYEILPNEFQSEPDLILPDLFGSQPDLQESNDVVSLDGPMDSGGLIPVVSDCRSPNDQRNSKLRLRGEDCKNPSAALEIPSIAIEGASSIASEQKPRCDEGEEHLCCKGRETQFWNKFRSIVSQCAKCQTSRSLFASVFWDECHLWRTTLFPTFFSMKIR